MDNQVNNLLEEIRIEHGREIRKIESLKKDIHAKFNQFYLRAVELCEHDWKYVIEYYDKNYYRCKHCNSETSKLPATVINVPQLQQDNSYVSVWLGFVETDES